ncbi:MAG: TolB family protein, partial [Acidimicrobiia bacterium]
GDHRRRRVLVPALTAASAVIAGMIGIVTLTGGEGGQQVVTQPPASETPVPGDGPDTTATTAPASVPLPETFLAVRDHATELVMVETATGQVRRTLVDLGDFPENGTEEDRNFWPYIDGLTVTPDGRTVYYSTGPEPAPGNVYRISTDGGEPEFIANGAHPRVSPDGRYVAWQNGSIQTIAIQDLETGTVRTLEQGEDNDEYPGPISWVDNTALAFESRTFGASDSENATRIRVVDADARSLDDSREVADEPRMSLHLTGYRAYDGLLGVLETLPEADGGTRFSVRDPKTGHVLGTLELPFTATGSVYDRSGRHQLFVTDGGEVLRRSGGGFTTVLRPGDVTLVAW